MPCLHANLRPTPLAPGLRNTPAIRKRLCCVTVSGSVCSVCCGLFTACLGNSSGNWKAEPPPLFPENQGVPAPADAAERPRSTALTPRARAGPGVQTTACVCRAGSQEENIVLLVDRVPPSCACSPTHSSLCFHTKDLRKGFSQVWP